MVFFTQNNMIEITKFSEISHEIDVSVGKYIKNVLYVLISNDNPASFRDLTRVYLLKTDKNMVAFNNEYYIYDKQLSINGKSYKIYSLFRQHSSTVVNENKLLFYKYFNFILIDDVDINFNFYVNGIELNEIEGLTRSVEVIKNYFEITDYQEPLFVKNHNIMNLMKLISMKSIKYYFPYLMEKDSIFKSTEFCSFIRMSIKDDGTIKLKTNEKVEYMCENGMIINDVEYIFRIIGIEYETTIQFIPVVICKKEKEIIFFLNETTIQFQPLMLSNYEKITILMRVPYEFYEFRMFILNDFNSWVKEKNINIYTNVDLIPHDFLKKYEYINYFEIEENETYDILKPFDHNIFRFKRSTKKFYFRVIPSNDFSSFDLIFNDNINKDFKQRLINKSIITRLDTIKEYEKETIAAAIILSLAGALFLFYPELSEYMLSTKGVNQVISILGNLKLMKSINVQKVINSVNFNARIPSNFIYTFSDVFMIYSFYKIASPKMKDIFSSVNKIDNYKIYDDEILNNEIFIQDFQTDISLIDIKANYFENMKKLEKIDSALRDENYYSIDNSMIRDLILATDGDVIILNDYTKSYFESEKQLPRKLSLQSPIKNKYMLMKNKRLKRKNMKSRDLFIELMKNEDISNFISTSTFDPLYTWLLNFNFNSTSTYLDDYKLLLLSYDIAEHNIQRYKLKAIKQELNKKIKISFTILDEMLMDLIRLCENEIQDHVITERASKIINIRLLISNLKVALTEYKKMYKISDYDFINLKKISDSVFMENLGAVIGLALIVGVGGITFMRAPTMIAMIASLGTITTNKKLVQMIKEPFKQPVEIFVDIINNYHKIYSTTFEAVASNVSLKEKKILKFTIGYFFIRIIAAYMENSNESEDVKRAKAIAFSLAVIVSGLYYVYRRTTIIVRYNKIAEFKTFLSLPENKHFYGMIQNF